jgi:hypothetical protein
MSDRDGERLKVPIGPVVPGPVQFNVQHNRAAVTCGAPVCCAAVSQQSLMPAIGHLCALSLPWTPASALPEMAAMRIKTVNHFRIIGKRLY